MNTFARYPLKSARAVRSIFLLVVSLLAADQAAAQQWARDLFPTTTHEFGTVAAGSKNEYTFELRNKHRETVHIAAVKSSCGCTSVKLLKDTIPGGETGGIVATFNTTSHSGSKTATLTVVIDRPYYAEVQLLVTGNILTSVSYDPPEVAFGTLPEGTEPTREITVRFNNRPQLILKDVRSECDDLRVRLGERIVSGNDVSYTLSVSLKPSRSPGPIHERLSLVTNYEDLQNVIVGISGSVRSPIEISPSALHLTPAAGQSASGRLTLLANKPFEITDIRCEDSRFQFVAPMGENKVHFIKVTFTSSGANLGAFKTPLQIKTSLPDSESIDYVITGEVKQGN